MSKIRVTNLSRKTRIIIKVMEWLFKKSGWGMITFISYEDGNYEYRMLYKKQSFNPITTSTITISGWDEDKITWTKE